ncbi:MAG: HlyD family secretion protein [Candidatus Cryptobacteroides sp.]
MDKKKNFSLLIGVAALIAIVLIVAVIGYFVSRPKPVVIQGEVEATEYRVSGKVPGRVERFMADEGMMVHKGDTLVEIDSPEVKAKLAQAVALRNAAQSQRDKALNGARQEQIAGAYELWQQAKVQEEVMKKSYDRIKKLYEQKVVPAQKYDEVEAKYNASKAQAKAAQSQYNMAVKGARNEDKAAALALVDQANGAIAEVESYLGELFLTAPADGMITARFPKAGELVGTGTPIMTVTDLNDSWFTFNVREERMSEMKVGTNLKVKIPAVSNEIYTAEIYYISALASYATWRATQDTGGYDSKTFEVRARPLHPIEGLRPGMSAIVVNE